MFSFCFNMYNSLTEIFNNLSVFFNSFLNRINTFIKPISISTHPQFSQSSYNNSNIAYHSNVQLAYSFITPSYLNPCNIPPTQNSYLICK